MTQVFCKFFDTSKNIFFTEHIWVTVSVDFHHHHHHHHHHCISVLLEIMLPTIFDQVFLSGHIVSFQGFRDLFQCNSGVSRYLTQVKLIEDKSGK